jgi:transglutaminase-like putative cysteine protease
MERYLKPTPTIDCETASIKERARLLTEGHEKVIDKAKPLFYFVRDEIKYNPYLYTYVSEPYRASATLERREGFCIQKAILLAALARAVGIPVRLGFADIRNHLSPKKLTDLMNTDVYTYHGYCELYIESKWVKATPVFDLKTCEESGIIPTEFDGKHDAIFHSHDRDGNPHIEYVRNHGHYEDLPLDAIVGASSQLYGDGFEQMMHRERLLRNSGSC